MRYFARLKTKLMVGLAIIGTLALSPSGLFAAEEEKPVMDMTVSVLSQYILRGYELSRNSVVIQPSLTAGYKGFSVNVWGNMDTKPYYSGSDVGKSYSSAWNETDITLSCSKTMDMFTLGGGYIYTTAWEHSTRKRPKDLIHKKYSHLSA
jgi:hypothetical protein